MGINKYIVAYKNYKETWIKKSRMPELSSPRGLETLKLVEKEPKEEPRRSSTIKKSMRTRNSSQPLRNSVCSNCKISTKSTCSRMTTLLFISESLRPPSLSEKIFWSCPE